MSVTLHAGDELINRIKSQTGHTVDIEQGKSEAIKGNDQPMTGADISEHNHLELCASFGDHCSDELHRKVSGFQV